MDLSRPIFSAPPGYRIDLANPQRSGVAANIWVGTVGMCIAVVFMGIRIYTKIVLARDFASDDGALLIAWLFSIAVQGCTLFQYGRGTLGIHIWELSGFEVQSALNLVMVASILYCPFLAFAKFSLLLFYLKLSPLRCFRLCIYASMFLVFGYSIALLGPLIFPCTPFKKTWDMTVTEGSCIDRTPVYMATAVLNMITDFLLLVLPLPMVVNLHAPRAQKVGLICAFGIGSVTCITSGVRLALLFPMLHTVDQTWAIVMPGLWILIEANLVIITGCLPAMRLFLRHVAPRLIGEPSTCRRGYNQGIRNEIVLSRATELQTVGSNCTTNRYNRMDDYCTSLSSEQRAVAGWQGDQDSEQGMVIPVGIGNIVKTDTIHVESDIAETAGKSGTSWRATF